jgi:phosphoglycerol transferase
MIQSSHSCWMPSKAWLCAAFGLVGALVFVHSGLYAIVFADEFAYSKSSRLVEPSSSPISNYIYLYVYSVTNVCGDQFLGCARLLNAAFLMASSIAFYAIARTLIDTKIAGFVSLFPIVFPSNSYIAYFMPEAFYQLLVYIIVIWLILGRRFNPVLHSAVAGVLFGFAILVKVHALFLSLSYFVCLILMNITRRETSLLEMIWKGLIFVVSILFVRFGLGYLIAGSNGLAVFGASYSSLANSTADKTDLYGLYAQGALRSLLSHLLFLVLLLPLPAFLLAERVWEEGVGIFRSGKRDMPPNVRGHEFAVVVFSILLVMLPVTALFTAVVATGGGMESLGRLHMRYYNFMLPLMGLLAVIELQFPRPRMRRPVAAAILLVYTVLAAYAVSSAENYSATNFVDAPLYQAILGGRFRIFVLASAGLLILALWTWRRRVGALCYLTIMLPALLLASNVETLSKQWPAARADSAILGANATTALLPHADVGKVVVVGSGAPGLLKAAFYLDSPEVAVVVVESGSTYDSSKVPAGKKWVLFIGSDVKSGPGLSAFVSGNDFRLVGAETAQ